MMNEKIFLCSICNINSGTCKEDCKFCTQSIKYQTNINRFKEKSLKDILLEAEENKKNQAVGMCLVTAGKSLTDKRLNFICKIAKEIKKRFDFNLIACNGTATIEQLKELKKAGIDSYNHNLETSEKFYPQICTSHPWNERYETCLNVKEVGLKLCTGGIFGLGENQNDRISLVNSLKSLNPNTIPINFFHPNDALPLSNKIISKDEAIKIIQYVKKEFNSQKIMVAGGRELIFNNNYKDIFEAGANSIVIGNYLTTQGATPLDEINTLHKLNYKIAKDCNE